MSDGVSGGGGWASCDVPGVESGDVFGSVREKRLSAGDGALREVVHFQGNVLCQIYGRGARARATHHPTARL